MLKEDGRFERDMFIITIQKASNFARRIIDDN